MYELKKNGQVVTSKFVGTGPSSYKKRIYRAVVSQRLRNTVLYYFTYVDDARSDTKQGIIQFFFKACSITYVILHAIIIYISLSTRYSLMLFCLFVSLIYITLPARYTLTFFVLFITLL